MVRPEVVRRRLHKLDEYLAILQTSQRDSLGTFLDDPKRYGSTERFLHLSIESLILVTGLCLVTYIWRLCRW